jgi:hypothetical protein
MAAYDESSQPASHTAELFSRYSRTLRHPSFEQASECPGGTRAGFAKATARIHDTSTL